MATTTTKTNKPILPRGADNRPVDSYNRAKLFSGKALDFDGVNDILTMPTALTSSLSTTTITHVLNFKTDFSSFASSRDDVFSYSERGIIFTFNFGNIVVYYRHSGGSWGAITIPTDKIKLQEWNHCAIVIDYNNDLGKVYINGHEVVSISSLAGANIAYDSNALTIGAQTGARFFDGQIAGFKIFNTALTAAQVADLYNNPEKVVPTGVDNTALKLWLPMQEGAGTTAYDGSGNGNHGTISGATYTHGIGAPVAQTSVIDWNKELNLAPYSEDFTQSAYSKTGVVLTANDIVSPNGLTTGTKVAMNQDAESGVKLFTPMNAGAYTMKYFVKAGTITNAKFYQIEQGVAVRYMDIDLANGTISNVPSAWDSASIQDAGNGWYLISVTNTMNAYHSGHGYGLVVSNENGNYFYLWGFHHKEAATLESYVPNFTASSLTSPVLLPQGLTSGRDITGVNLFENVRKQGALNLDDNSWAEVHDNASLDITDAITLEAWVYWVPQTSSNNGILSRWDSSTNKKSYILYQTSTGNAQINISTDGSTSSGVDLLSAPNSDEWHHIVGTYDGSEIKIYVDGAYSDKVSYTGNIYVSDINTDIAAYNNDNYLNSQLAQPRIYNRALTAEEVQRNYNAGKNIYS